MILKNDFFKVLYTSNLQQETSFGLENPNTSLTQNRIHMHKKKTITSHIIINYVKLIHFSLRSRSKKEDEFIM